MRRLVTAVKDLSRARSNEDIAAIVRTAARDLNGADGATFVLREGEKCFYLRRRRDRSIVEGKAIPARRMHHALKYTQRKARTTIWVGRSDRDGVPAYFVQDDGVGFDPASAGKLFQPFNRLHRDEDFRGTGVGLSTCERIVRRHGGWITAESKPGEGATFRFSLRTEST